MKFRYKVLFSNVIILSRNSAGFSIKVNAIDGTVLDYE